MQKPFRGNKYKCKNCGFKNLFNPETNMIFDDCLNCDNLTIGILNRDYIYSQEEDCYIKATRKKGGN